MAGRNYKHYCVIWVNNDLLEGDPTITNGIFDIEIFKYYASAALLEIYEIHKKILKKKP